MAQNDFLPFASAAGSNVLTQAQYAAAAYLSTGFSSGTAPSAGFNKALRQSSIMAAVLAQFISQETGANVVDDGTTATILQNLSSAISKATLQPTVTALSATGALTQAQMGSLVEFSASTAQTATLPTPVGVTGQGYWFSNVGSASWTIATTAGAFNGSGFAGAATVLAPPQSCGYLVSDNVNWVVLTYSLPPSYLLSEITTSAAGTSDAITANFSPAITSLVNGMTLYVRAASANTTSTPTFQANATAAKTIVKGAGSALSAGDIAGGGHWIEVQYDQTLDKWVLLNPATGVSSSSPQLQSVAATVSANALTATLNPTRLDFRSTSLASGAPVTRTLGTAATLTVPSGATLGTISAVQSRLALLAIDNAGTVELAIVNLAGGNNLDETSLISTTAISAAATAANVIYSTTARANVAFRVVGFIDITEAAAGTWAAAPSLVQGTGGQALAALSSLGYGQTPQDVTASRVAGTTYYNTTGKPIFVDARMTSTASANPYIQVGTIKFYGTGNTAGSNLGASAVVPPGQSYLISSDGGTTTLNVCSELR